MLEKWTVLESTGVMTTYETRAPQSVYSLVMVSKMFNFNVVVVSESSFDDDVDDDHCRIVTLTYPSYS